MNYSRLWPTFKKGTHATSRVTGWIASIVMVCMMFLTAADIIGRLIKVPLVAAHDVTELMMVILVFWGLAFTSTVSGHVQVELLTSRLSLKKRHYLELFTSFLSILVFIVMIWGLITRITLSIAGNWGTPTVGIPVYPFLILAVIGCIFLIFELIIQFQESFSRAVGTADE